EVLGSRLHELARLCVANLVHGHLLTWYSVFGCGLGWASGYFFSDIFALAAFILQYWHSPFPSHVQPSSAIFWRRANFSDAAIFTPPLEALRRFSWTLLSV